MRVGVQVPFRTLKPWPSTARVFSLPIELANHASDGLPITRDHNVLDVVFMSWQANLLAGFVVDTNLRPDVTLEIEIKNLDVALG